MSVLDHIAVNINLIPLTLLLQRLSKHQLSHPINPLIPAPNRKIMRLPLRATILAITIHHRTFSLPQPNTFLDRSRDELEAKCRFILLILVAARDVHGFESGVELGTGGERGARDGIVVDVDVLECFESA